MSSRYEEANKPSSWTNELNSVVQRTPPTSPTRPPSLGSQRTEKRSAPRHIDLEALQPDGNALKSRTRDAVVEVQSQAGATLQTISYANLKYGLTRQSVSFCLWQSTLDDLSPKPSFRRLPPPTAGRPGRTAAGGFLRRSSNGRRETTRNLPRQTTHKLTRPPSRISTDLLQAFSLPDPIPSFSPTSIEKFLSRPPQKHLLVC